MRQPDIFKASTLTKWDVSIQNKAGKYIPARPSYGPIDRGLLYRIKTTWLVFTGKADVVKWDN